MYFRKKEPSPFPLFRKKEPSPFPLLFRCLKYFSIRSFFMLFEYGWDGGFFYNFEKVDREDYRIVLY